MPARKPSILSKRHDTNADKAARASDESALVPRTTLTKNPPSALKGHAHAGSVWRRLYKLYSQTEGTIVTAFDGDLLVKYCLAEEEVVELFEMRREVKEFYAHHKDVLAGISPTPETMKDYFNALAQMNALLQRFQGMDARLDGKRKYLHTLAQSLYLTPRSRAGVAPPEKEEDPQDGADTLFDG